MPNQYIDLITPERYGEFVQAYKDFGVKHMRVARAVDADPRTCKKYYEVGMPPKFEPIKLILAQQLVGGNTAPPPSVPQDQVNSTPARSSRAVASIPTPGPLEKPPRDLAAIHSALNEALAEIHADLAPAIKRENMAVKAARETSLGAAVMNHRLLMSFEKLANKCCQHIENMAEAGHAAPKHVLGMFAKLMSIQKAVNASIARSAEMQRLIAGLPQEIKELRTKDTSPDTAPVSTVERAIEQLERIKALRQRMDVIDVEATSYQGEEGEEPDDDEGDDA